LSPSEPVSTAGRQLLSLLPGIYQEQPTVAALVGAFERVWLDPAGEPRSVSALIASLPEIFSAADTPERFLPWLAEWVGMPLAADLTVGARRQLVARAVPLYQRRGTPQGLAELLTIVTERPVTILEPERAGFRVGAAIVGRTTQVGRDRPHYFEVAIDVAGLNADATARVERLTRTFADAGRPAHTHYQLKLLMDAERSSVSA
jgi:phage tail-like protein